MEEHSGTSSSRHRRTDSASVPTKLNLQEVTIPRHRIENDVSPSLPLDDICGWTWGLYQRYQNVTTYQHTPRRQRSTDINILSTRTMVSKTPVKNARTLEGHFLNIYYHRLQREAYLCEDQESCKRCTERGNGNATRYSLEEQRSPHQFRSTFGVSFGIGRSAKDERLSQLATNKEVLEYGKHATTCNLLLQDGCGCWRQRISRSIYTISKICSRGGAHLWRCLLEVSTKRRRLLTFVDASFPLRIVTM